MVSKTKLFLSYSFFSFIELFKKMDTWIYLLTFTSILSFFSRQRWLTITTLFLILLLSIIRDFTSPSFKHYAREKQGIPSKGDIRRLKQKQRNGVFRRIQGPIKSEERTSLTLEYGRDRISEQYSRGERGEYSSEEQDN